MKKTFAILGCGFLGNIVADAYKKGLLEGYELIGVMSRSREKAEKLAVNNIKICNSDAELLALHPDYIVETASVKALKNIAVKALKQGSSIIPLSIGAFADKTFYKDAKAAAIEGGAKIHIPSGAVGGFDVMQTIALMAEAQGKALTAEISTHKGPKSLMNTPLYTEELMTDTNERKVFDGKASEAIQLLPTKVNVAVASALASAGPDETGTIITSVPEFVGDDHCITVTTEGIKAVVDIYSSTSAIAGWSLVALMRNLVSPVVFY